MIAIFIVVMIFASRVGLCIDRNSEEQSVNEVEDKNSLDEEEKHFYYLPQQTVFGRPGSFMGMDGSKTLPPSIMIEPSTTLLMREYHATSSEFNKELTVNGRPTKADSNYCTSEDILDSELLPSKDILKDSVMLSGYMETPSKTSDDYHMPLMSSLVSSDDNILIGL